MPGMIENALGMGLGFVTKPIGAAVTAVALTAVIGGGLYVKNWWDGVQEMDETIAAQDTQIDTLRVDLHTSEQNAADARIGFGQRVADLQNQIRINSEEAATQRQRARRLAIRIQELQHEETGPIAPVLVHALNSVRDDLRGFSPT